MSDTTTCPRCGENFQHAHICSGNVQWKLCLTHGLMHYSPSCLLCDQEQRAQAREAIAILEARIADLETRLLSTNRQLAVLHQTALDLQRAHNALVAHIAPNPDLLP